MSAALALDTPVRIGGPHLDDERPWERPRLHLVPTGPDVVGKGRPVRVTRRGRLLRTGVLAVAVLVVAWTVLSALSAVSAAAVTPHLVTGQTLSEIALTELPGVPVRDGVAALQLANGLHTSDIHAGQVLTIPAAG